MKKLLTFALCAVGLTSCLTESKMKKHGDMYYGAHPNELAVKCNNEFPTIILPGIPVITRDTTLLAGLTIPCPEAPKDSITGKPKTVYVNCPDEKVINTFTFIHDTIYDNSRIAVFKGDTAAKGAENRALYSKLTLTIAEKDKALKQAKSRLYLVLGLGLLSVLFLFIIIKFIVL